MPRDSEEPLAGPRRPPKRRGYFFANQPNFSAARPQFPRRGAPSFSVVRSALLGSFSTPRMRYPAGVNRQTSQSFLIGLANQGRAQPRSTQDRMVRMSISCPSSSNKGSLPPGSFNPRIRYLTCAHVGFELGLEGICGRVSCGPAAAWRSDLSPPSSAGLSSVTSLIVTFPGKANKKPPAGATNTGPSGYLIKTRRKVQTEIVTLYAPHGKSLQPVLSTPWEKRG